VAGEVEEQLWLYHMQYPMFNLHEVEVVQVLMQV
jgi:hypothetical protein